jgi:hypothetical protein
VDGCATEREAAVRAAFADQADWCLRLGSPLTAAVCRLAGERIDRSTALGRQILGWRGDPRSGKDVLPLRLAGGLQALVRRGAAPALAACYPPHDLPDDETLWTALRTALADEALPPWLDLPPQTNEVGRSAVLMAGLLAAAERFGRPLELLELGASAGLNLILDRYGYRLGGVTCGDPASPLRLEPEWRGPPPPAAEVRIAGRRGVDLQPMDPCRDGERLLAYVWPDQRRRVEQLETALAVAAADPPRIDRGDAAAWLEQRLAEPPEPGAARIVLHSVAFQYFPLPVQARVERAVERAEEPIGWLRFERVEGEADFTLRLRCRPGGTDELLARAHPHGAWVEWLRARER